MTTYVRRVWMNYDSRGVPQEVRADFSDKLANFHIGVKHHTDPIEFAGALISAGRGLLEECKHLGITGPQG